MDIANVVHMNGGDGETSYANNSLFQGKVISCTKLIREEAITILYSTKLPRSLAIADLGCSFGSNTLNVVSEIIKVVEKLCKKFNCSSPEYKIFFNDLPTNDFNNIFMSLDKFKVKLFDETKAKLDDLYFFGVPSSFYGKIFPYRSLHFVHSSYSLHWLSKVPEGIENNMGNVYINKRSPLNVIKAYYEQFERDMSIFLKCRAEEVVEGGSMVLTFMGRKSDDPCSKECCYISELLAIVLNHMVSQGIIKEDQVKCFNIPNYYPSPSEVKLEVQKEGSFVINHVEVFDVDLNVPNGGYTLAQSLRAVVEPLLAILFDEVMIDKVFRHYQQLLVDRMSKEKMMLTSITISLTRKP